MKDIIAQTAGKIWNLLGQKNEISLAQLPRILKVKSEVAYQALGWLAREDKIVYTTRGGRTLISLTPSELSIHKVVAPSRA
jgi:Mn-dependent DtxR family transcriptional regulator